MQVYKLPIARLVDGAPHVRTFLFDIPDGLAWDPGAHCHVALPGFDADGKRHPELVRHMSVCTLAEEGKLGFTTRLNSSDSPFKRALANKRPGDELALFKFGSILGIPDNGRAVVLLSQGVGIASMRPLLLHFARLRARGGLAHTPSLTSITVDAGEAPIYGSELSALRADGLRQQRVAHRSDFEKAVRELTAQAQAKREAERSQVEREPTAHGHGALGNALFEVVGSGNFLLSTIALLRGLDVADSSILLDKRPEKAAMFFSA